MSYTRWKFVLLAAVLLSLTGRELAAATPIGSVTITGGEQSSGGVWDTGTVTATINGISVSFAYGQFSTPAAIASALGTLISQNCSMPVYVKAMGTTLTLYQKGSNTISSANITSVSSDPSLFPSNSFLVGGGGAWSLPQITSLSLTEGPPGMGFVITGANFGSTQGTVLIGNVAATVIPGTWTPTTIAVQVPNGLTAGPIAYVGIIETSSWTGATFSFQVDAPFPCN